MPIKTVELKDGRQMEVDTNTLSQAKRIAKAHGVSTSGVLLKMMQNDPAARNPDDVFSKTPEESTVGDKILGTLGQAAQRSAEPERLMPLREQTGRNIESAGLGGLQHLLGVGQMQLDIANKMPDALNLPKALFGQDRIDRLKDDITLAGNSITRFDQERNPVQGDIMRPVGGFAVDMAATKGIPIPGLGERGLAPLLKRTAVGTGFGAGIGGSQFEESGSPQARFEKAKTGAAIGGTIPAATGVVGGTVRRAMNFRKSVLAPIVKRAMKTPQFAKMTEVEKSTGLKLSVAQKSGDPQLINIEQGTRQPFFGAKKAMEMTNRELRNQTDVLNNHWRKFSKAPTNTEALGRRLQDGYEKVINAANKKRSLNGKILFGKYDEVSKNIGIPMKNYIKVLKDIERNAGGAERSALGKQPATILKSIKDGTYSGKQFKNELSFLSSATKGKGGILEGVNFDKQKEIALRLVKAMEKDISAFSGELKKQGMGDAAKALNIARQTWKFDSNGIDNFTKGALAKLIGKGGKSAEDLANQFMRLQNSGKRAGFSMLRDIDPKLEGDVKGFVIKNTLDEATKLTGKSVAQNAFDPLAWIAKVSPNVKQKRAILSTFAGGERHRISNLIDGMRAAGSTFTPSSKQQAASLLTDTMGNLAGGNPIFLARMFGKTFGPAAISHYLRDPAGIKALEMFIKNAPKINAPASVQRAVVAFHALQNIEKQKENNNGK